jgi:hypothetical protein
MIGNDAIDLAFFEPHPWGGKHSSCRQTKNGGCTLFSLSDFQLNLIISEKSRHQPQCTNETINI